MAPRNIPYEIKISDRKYRIKKLIHGLVYCATDEDGDEVAVKFEAVCAVNPKLKDEAHSYYSLAGGPGIPQIHGFGVADEYNCLVLEMLGPNSEDIFNLYKKNLSNETILRLSYQFIESLEYIHRHSFVLQDITPRSLVMGVDKYGSHCHIVCSQAMRYISASQTNNQTMCRGNLVSLGYVMIFLFRGNLDWHNLKSESIVDLCRNLPKEFSDYFKIVETLRINEEVDYSSIKNWMGKLFQKRKIKRDYIYDWIEGKYEKYNKANAKIVAKVTNRVDTTEELFESRGQILRMLIDIETNEKGVQQRTCQLRSIFFEYYHFAMVFSNLATREWPLEFYHQMSKKVWQLIQASLEDLSESCADFLTLFRPVYSVTILLFQTAPKLESTWIDYLCVLARYRQLTENHEVHRKGWESAHKYWSQRQSKK